MSIINLINQIVKESDELCLKYFNQTFKPDYVTVFTKDKKEFNGLSKQLTSLGKIAENNNGPVVVLNNPILTPGGKILVVRIRRPDSTITQIGDTDYEVDNYSSFKKRYINKFPENLKLIVRKDYEMFQLTDNDSKVMACFPNETEIKYLKIN